MEIWELPERIKCMAKLDINQHFYYLIEVCDDRNTF